MTYVLIAIVVLVLIFAKMALVIIPQSETKIIERLGRYYATLRPGINIIIPIVDRAKEIVVMRAERYVYSNSIDLREQVYDFPKQNVITKDNVQTEINALLYFQIVDPFKAVYEINNLPNAIEKLTQTTLRNIIGELELDETLTSRDTINTKLRSVLDDATNKWGIKVNRVELQDITPPESVLTAMEKQMQAERNKRATILTSEGKKASDILQSEGEKMATINRAEALKQQAILKAEGEAQARIRKTLYLFPFALTLFLKTGDLIRLLLHLFLLLGNRLADLAVLLQNFPVIARELRHVCAFIQEITEVTGGKKRLNRTCSGSILIHIFDPECHVLRLNTLLRLRIGKFLIHGIIFFLGSTVLLLKLIQLLIQIRQLIIEILQIFLCIILLCLKLADSVLRAIVFRFHRALLRLSRIDLILRRSRCRISSKSPRQQQSCRKCRR